MRYSELTEEKIREIIDFYLIPHTGREAQIHFDISQAMLERILREANIQKHSKETITALSRQKARATCLEKYGCEHPGGLPEFVDKAQQTNLIKYGARAPLQNDEIWQRHEQTKLERYGNARYVNHNKAKQTNLKRYGVECTLQVEEIKEKSRQTKLERYGDANFVNREQTRQTCLERYGVEESFCIESAKQKSRQTCIEKYGTEYALQNKDIQAKQQRTNLERYGSSSYLTSEDCKQQLLDKYGVDNYTKTEEFLIKQRETKIANDSLNSSQAEELVYRLLCEKFNSTDVVRQYKEARYPFNCDFYIKSLDLFIELNGFWTHGFKPFEGTPEDLVMLEHWKDQLDGPHAPFYESAIENWTVRDVKKITTAKNNGLNYITIYPDEYDRLEEGEITIDEILKIA